MYLYGTVRNVYGSFWLARQWSESNISVKNSDIGRVIQCYYRAASKYLLTIIMRFIDEYKAKFLTLRGYALGILNTTLLLLIFGLFSGNSWYVQRRVVVVGRDPITVYDFWASTWLQYNIRSVFTISGLVSSYCLTHGDYL
jgi:hypothetical protein